jgi:hypothetical protein
MIGLTAEAAEYAEGKGEKKINGNRHCEEPTHHLLR